jgi:hypothetical protein
VSCAAPASASIIVDGTRDATYGSAIAVQTVETRYGDEDGIGVPNGSELDAAYAKVWNGRLYFMLTGNLENDGGNKLSVYIDSKAGGENTLTNTPDYDSMTGPNWRSNTLGGMTFDAGFMADYHLIVRRNGANLEVDFVDRAGGATEQVPGAKGMAPFVRIDALPDPHLTNFVTSAGTIAAGALGPNASASSLTQALNFGFNNSNAAGVLGRKADLTACGGTDACIAADPVAAAAVATGLEFSIDLADLGAPGVGSEIKLAAMIGNGDFNDYSNQFLGGLPAPHAKFPAASLPFNLANEAGNQYFSVTVTAEVPEPAALALVGLAVVGAGLFRREQRV